MDARQPAVDVQRGRGAPLTLTAAHVGELVDELRPLAEGAEVRDVVALPPRDLLLLLRPAGEEGPTLRLRLSAAPDLPRLFLQSARQTRPSGPPGPFFRRAAEELTGARLRRLEQVRGDRLVRLGFDRTVSGAARGLVLELTGRRANLVLLGAGERVLEVLVPPKAKAAQAHRLTAGEPWSPPTGAPRGAEAGPPLAAALAHPTVPPLHPGTPPAADGDTPFAPHPRAPLSYLVERVLGARLGEATRDRSRRELTQRLERKLRRARSLLAGLEEKAAAAEGADRVRLDGELLKANLHRVRRGLESLEVEDLYGEPGSRRTLTLDPRRSPRENVERAFERYHKLVRSQANVSAELGLCAERVAALEDLARQLADPACDPAALEARAVERGLLDRRQEGDPRKRKAPEPRLPYRRFTALHGAEIRVGRTARDNDELTLRHSKGSDLWLHTADTPGSHVVLRLDKGREADPEELLDAAHLAVHFSPARRASKAPVHVAARKFVSKPKGAKPGLVTLSGGRTLMVRVQPERLERLLAGGARRSPSDLGRDTAR